MIPLFTILLLTATVLQTGASHVTLLNGALAKNIYWQVAGYINVGVDSHMEGILMSKTKIVMETGSSLNGRILAQTASTLDMATITEPAPSNTTSPTSTSPTISGQTAVPSTAPSNSPSNPPNSSATKPNIGDDNDNDLDTNPPTTSPSKEPTSSPSEPAPDPVPLGFAGEYTILTKSGVTNVPTSIIIGDIGVSPITVKSVTGFDFEFDSGGNDATPAKFATSYQVRGNIYGADMTGVTAGSTVEASLTRAVLDMETAYTSAANIPNNDDSRKEICGGVLNTGCATLTPGVYTFTTNIVFTGDIVFDGGPDDVFIIQTTGYVRQTKPSRVLLRNGARAKNIVWQVASYFHVGVNCHMEGIIMTYAHVEMKTGSSLNGRIFAQTAATLEMVTIINPMTVTHALENRSPQFLNSLLGGAGEYTMLTQSGISTVPPSIITGDVGVWPIALTAVTGFAVSLDIGGQFATATQVTDQIHAADMNGDVAARLTSAVFDMHIAYTHIANIPSDFLKKELCGGLLGVDGKCGGPNAPLTPGVYTFTSNIAIDNDIVFDGGPEDIFIIQTTGNVEQTGAGPGAGAARREAILLEVFNAFDSDGDKKIDLEDFKAAFLTFFPSYTSAQIEDIFMKADINNDDYLDWEEFLAAAEASNLVPETSAASSWVSASSIFLGLSFCNLYF